MAKSRSVGTKLKIAAKTGNTKVEVGGLKSVSGIDASGGEVTVSGYMDGEDEGQTRMYELMESGDVVDCEIVFPAKIGKTWSFKAGVTKFTTAADVDDAITFDATLKVSGKPTLAATTSV